MNKRLMCALLAVIISSCVFIGAADNSVELFEETVIVGTTEETLTAVYAYGGYTIALRNAKYVSGGRDDGRMLTDRKYTLAKPQDDDDRTEGWVMIKSYDDSTDFRATVTIDFGFYAKDITRFYLRAFRSTSLLAEMPERIRFYISADGDSYEYMGDGSTMTDLSIDNSAAVYGLTLKKGVNARYMRAIIDCKGGNYALWLNEVGAAAVGQLFNANDDGSSIFYDRQGLAYRITDGNAEVIGFKTESEGNYGELIPSDKSFNESGKTYKLGIGSDNEITVISDFIGEGRPNYSGVPNNIQYIVIHNTGTAEENTDAERYNHRMHTTDGETSWHYTVDENVIYHSLADSIVGWHAGSSHNYESIGIEICVNGAPKKSSSSFIFSGSTYEEWVETRFKKTLRNTAVLVAELLTRYGLSTDAVIQHYDVTEKNCPLWLREKDGKFVYEGTLWLEFMSYVEEYYELYNGKADKPVIRPESNIVIPDYLTVNGGEVYPVTAIGKDAFVGKDGKLFSLEIGKMVETVAEGCFDGSDSLEKVTVASGGSFTVSENGTVCGKNGNVIFDPDARINIQPSPKSDCTLDIRYVKGRYFIFCIEKTFTLAELAENYGAENARAFTSDGRDLLSSDTAGTGTVLNLDGARLYTVVRGDANGDACIDQYDYILAKRTYLNNYFPTDSQFLAMAINGKDEVTVYDYILIKRHFMKTLDLTKYKNQM